MYYKKWTPDARRQTPAERGERESPRITLREREIFIALIPRIRRNRRQTSDIRHQPRGERENHPHLNPLPSRARKKYWEGTEGRGGLFF